MMMLALGIVSLETQLTAGLSPRADEAAVIERCDDVPRIVSDVAGTNAGNVDPIYLGVVNSYVNEYRDVFGGLWIDLDAGGTLVVAFTDDPEPHRRALAARRPTPTDDVEVVPRPPIVDDRPLGEWDQAFDVVQVEFTARQLHATQRAVVEWLDEHGETFSAIGPDLQRNRVAVDLGVANAAVLSRLAADVPADNMCDDTAMFNPAEQYEPGDPLDVIVPVGSDGRLPPGTLVSCNDEPPSFPISALDNLEPLTETASPEIVAAIDPLPREVFPNDGWAVLTEDSSIVTLIRVDGGNAAFVTFRKTNAGLALDGGSGSGPCALRTTLPAGLNLVEWSLDPAQPANPDASVVEVLATERACASGQPIGDRLLGPQIIETDTEILIALTAIAQAGNQTCPANPSKRVLVQLSQPIGTRVIRDGTVITTHIAELTE